MTPLVIFVDDLETQASSQHAFIKSPVRIGRSELNDLPLPLPFVSGWHAVVRFDEEEVHYVDLGSTNGSVRDGERLEKNVPSPVGVETEIFIGTLRLRFTRRETGARPSPPPRPMTAFALHVSELNLAPVLPEVSIEEALPPVVEEVPLPPVAELPPPQVEPARPQLEPQQIERVDQALFDAAMDLDLSYASYRGAWEHLRGTIDQLVGGLEEAVRPLAMARLAEKYDALTREPQFQAMAGYEPASGPVPSAPPPIAVASPPVAMVAPPSPQNGKAVGLLAAFAESYLPEPDSATTDSGAAQLLGRTAEVLEAFGKSYLELRKGYEEFGKEMGVRAIRADSPVERARDVKQLLAYLLDLRAESRIPDLQSAYADLMMHQVALLNGVIEGARGILTRLSPDEVTGTSGQSKWPLKVGAYWKAYEERWHEIADEEDAISDALFGNEFVRAYTAIVGQRAGDEKPEIGDGTRPRITPPKRPTSPR